MKKIFARIIRFFYPLAVFKDCTVKDKKQKIVNFYHNKKHKIALVDCAINWFYLFCFNMLAVFYMEKPPSFIVSQAMSIENFIYGFFGTFAALSFTAGLYLLLAFVLISKFEIE